MKKIIFYIFSILIIGLISCSPKNTTYKGKYIDGMFNEHPRNYSHNLGMTKVKKKKLQNIQKCNRK